MDGFKFLIKRTFHRRIMVLITLLVAAAMMAAVMIFHEPLGADDDYLMCKLCAHLGSCFFVMLSYIFLSVDINGNRAMRAAPFSKSLRLKAVPLFCSIMGVSLTAVIDLIYSAYILISKQDMTNISDMLIISVPVLVCYVILGVIAMNMNYGSIIMVYLYIPMAGLGFLVPEKVWTDGFGMTVTTSLLIYIATAVACAVLAFVIARLFYEKAEFKPLPEQNMPTT